MADAAASVAVGVDVVVLTILQAQLSVLVRPHDGEWALLGGCLRADERLDVAARRQLGTVAGLLGWPAGAHLEQLRTYDTTKQGMISVAYLSLLPGPPDRTPDRHTADRGAPAHGDQAHGDHAATYGPIANVPGVPRWVPTACLTPPGAGRDTLEGTPALPLAPEHVPILADGVERARAKLEYSSLATAFCAEPFTLADLRRVYEAVWGVRLDVPNFRRKVLSTPGLVEPLGCRASPASGGRPAELYRRGAAKLLHPAMLRP